MKCLKRFSIRHKLMLTIVSLVLFIAFFTALTAFTNDTIQDKAVTSLLKKNQITHRTVITERHDANVNILHTEEIIILFSLMAIFIGMRIEALISEPLLNLDKAMMNVIIQNDYSTRTKKTTNDEIGRLSDHFNTMLEKIQYNEHLQHESQEQIKRLAYYDTLTGLPNRDLFKEKFQKAIRDAKINNHLIAVLYFDLDHFKLINDTFGHDMGDTVIQNTAKKIKACLQCEDHDESNDNKIILARLSGDEFIVVINNVSDVDEIKTTAVKMIESSHQPYFLKEKEITVTASIGISIYPTHGDNANDLIKKADIAMYFSKQQHSGQYSIFNEKMNAILINKIGIENDLRKALERNELILFYEPQFSISKNNIVGFEALLRWNHPIRGLLSPSEFIVIAENSGLIINIGAWIIKEACQQCQQWKTDGYEDIHISVNISPRQFSDFHLIKTVQNALIETQLEPSHLHLELTEGMILLNDQKTLDTLHQLNQLGVKISIDDFGTGYSSLRYLSQYPIEILKIDKSFISYVNENIKNATVTKAIIDLAHNLNLTVVAEGVETIEQLNYLKNNHCDVIQGYIIGRAATEKEVPLLLAKYGSDIDVTTR